MLNFKFTWQKISALPRCMKIQLLLLSLAVLGFVLLGADCYFLKHKENLFLKKQRQLTSAINAREKALQNFPQYKLQIAKQMQNYAKQSQALRRTFQARALIHALTQLAKNYQVTLVSFKPSDVEKKDTLQLYPWQIQALGDYQNLAKFLNALLQANFPYFVTTAALDLKPNTPNKNKKKKLAPKLVMHLKLLVYHDTKALSIVNAKTKTQNFPTKLLSPTALLRNPFLLVTKNSIHKKAFGLITNPLNKLKLLGILQQDQKNLAILQDAQGEVYKVHQGDQIGLEKKTIVRISKTAIIFKDQTEKFIYANSGQDAWG